jgi:hypothetical protein
VSLVRVALTTKEVGLFGATAVFLCLTLFLLLGVFAPIQAAAASPFLGSKESGAGPQLSLGGIALAAATPNTTASLHVTPTAGAVGSKFAVTGAGYPANSPLVLKWSTVNASWVVSGNPPQVTGTKLVNTMMVLGSAQTDSSGSFSVQLTAPTDYGNPNHAIQAFSQNGTAFPQKVLFDVEPEFRLSTTSGPAGTPITVYATGLGYSLYGTSYHVTWDNTYVGYATALTSRGTTNFTIYASGAPGTHYIDIYQGYPGPGYLNPQQGPPSGETQSNFAPLIPFHTQFTITTPPTKPSLSSWGPTVILAFAVVVAVLIVVQLVLLRGSARGKAVVKGIAAILLIVAVVLGGIGAVMLTGQGSPSPSTAYTPQATTVRPHITVPQSAASSGPRITITPNIVSVGTNITVNGTGFSPNARLPITWSTRQGSNIQGYQLVDLPLRNVTAGADGTFSFSMKVPYDLGGLHFISAGNLTRNSNGTLFLQRTASISATQGPPGTQIAIKLVGVGWDYNTNIATFDYDNSYIGYACGFNSQGNVTITVVASGSPGLHTIDVYPAIWWGTSTPAAGLTAEYRYPLLTPQDHPELMPAFHFTFMVTPQS